MTGVRSRLLKSENIRDTNFNTVKDVMILNLLLMIKINNLMNIIGIDPGINGGITILDEDGGIINQYVMPIIKSSKGKNEIDASGIVRIFMESGQSNSHIGLEKQQAMPKQGVSSTFKTGRGFGLIEGIAVGMMIPYTLITPRTWQKEMFNGLGKADTKQLSKQVAQRLFPKIDFRATERCTKIHDGLTDSILIAEYLRRTI